LAIELEIRLFSEPALQLMLLQVGAFCRVQPINVAMRMNRKLNA
jgi:hypothetical protein